MAMKTTMHILFTCKVPKRFWKIIRCWKDIKHYILGIVANCLVALFLSKRKEEFCLTLWCLWHDRNVMLHGGSWHNPLSLVEFVRQYITESQDA